MNATEQLTAKEYQELQNGNNKKKPVTPETQIQQACIKYARLFKDKFICEGTPAQAIRAKGGYLRMYAEGYIAGSSDIKIYGKDKILFIELKTEIGIQSEHQKKYQNMIEDLGHKYYLLRSFDDFKAVLDREFNLK